jgi:hypothetical protein
MASAQMRSKLRSASMPMPPSSRLTVARFFEFSSARRSVVTPEAPPS